MDVMNYSRVMLECLIFDVASWKDLVCFDLYLRQFQKESRCEIWLYDDFKSDSPITPVPGQGLSKINERKRARDETL